MGDEYRIPGLGVGRAWQMSLEARRAMQAMGCLVLLASVHGRGPLAQNAKDELSRLGRAAVRR